MNNPLIKSAGDLDSVSYSEEEVASIFALGRLLLEAGSVKQAEIIFAGLTEVSKKFLPAWLALSALYIQQNQVEAAINASKQALRINPESSEANLLLVSCLLSTGDIQSAGTYLGEVSDRIQSGSETNPNIIRFFKIQMTRFENR